MSAFSNPATFETPAADAATRLIIRQPDDWHVHLRDGAMLEAVVAETARQFARAIVMPNLAPPVTTVAAAAAYRSRILAALSPGSVFTPLMTAYLTDSTDGGELERGFQSGVFTAAKLYPAHATTNAALGVTDMERLYPVLETMQRLGMPLLLHGEVVDHRVDVFDREAVFIERVLAKLLAAFPALKIVLEHITTEEAVAFVESAGSTLGATITPHHLVINRNAMFEGGIRPHLYCLPVAKRERHRLALRRAATSGNPKFFLGTNSAPMPSPIKSQHADALEFSTLPWRSKPMRLFSTKKAPWTNWNPSQRKTVPASTVFLSIKAPSSSNVRRGAWRQHSMSPVCALYRFRQTLFFPGRFLGDPAIANHGRPMTPTLGADRPCGQMSA